MTIIDVIASRLLLVFPENFRKFNISGKFTTLLPLVDRFLISWYWVWKPQNVTFCFTVFCWLVRNRCKCFMVDIL